MQQPRFYLALLFVVLLGFGLSKQIAEPVSLKFAYLDPAPVTEVVEPVIEPVAEAPVTADKVAAAEPVAAPNKVLHQAPFTSQAPDGNWNAFYEEMCEEASMIIAWRYYLGDQTSYLDNQTVNQWLDEVASWERLNQGTDISTSIDQAYQALIDHFKLPSGNLEVVPVDSSEDLKELLAKGVVIAPFAGRLLGNPNYTGEGPRYHMLVMIGYEDNSFITHDVGTRKGAFYRYETGVLFNALHDFVAEASDIETGVKKVILITK